MNCALFLHQSIIDEYGCLRTGTKSTLVSKLKVDDLQPYAPDIVIVDGQQLLYDIVWPCAGSASDLANSMKDRLGQYQPTEVVVIFDRYDDMSAKDHERIRRAGEGAVNYNITISSKLPCRDAIMKSKANKKALIRVLSTFNLGNNVTMVGREESMYSHDEADITIIIYFLEAVKNGKNIVGVISDDTDVFVLLIYWVWRLQMTARVQLDRWCGAILNVNESSSLLGAISLQLLGMHALSGCDTVSYPFGHGKATVLKVLKSADHSGLYTVFGEQSANHQQLLETGHKFICSLYGVAAGETMTSARYALYTKRARGKAVCVKKLPPTDANLAYYILRAHYQVMLWKAADQQTPPAVDMAAYGWDVINCQCKAVAKACSSHACSCHSAG